MEPVLTVAEMQRVDAAASDRSAALMDAAGFSVARSAASMGASYGSVVHVLAGGGNNGGDGWVAARYLHRRGVSVTVHHTRLPDPDSTAGLAAHAARTVGVRTVPIGDVAPGDLVIDALYGTGLRGDLPDAVIPWIDCGIPVLSVDIPSGVSGDTGVASRHAFTAQRTATFHMLKTGHLLGDGPDRCGEIDLYDIGLAGGVADLWRFTESDVVVGHRPRTSHKWSVGGVAVVGGVPGLTGAAVLAARAAIAGGAGVAAILTTSGTAQTYEATAHDIVGIHACDLESWSDDAAGVLEATERFRTLIVGPGLEPADGGFVEGLISGFAGTLILDAGAINAVSRIEILRDRNGDTVLTPHAGEFKRLTGAAPTIEAVRDLSKRSGAVIVAKGNPTLVAGDRTVLVDRGGPELATIGTGDVLAGVIGALSANGVPAELAAASAAHIHAMAGEALAERETVSAPALVWEVGSTVASIAHGTSKRRGR